MMIHMAESLSMFATRKGETIEIDKKEKKQIFFLKSGAVKIINTRSNNIKYIINKGSIFGETTLFDPQQPCYETAIALEDCMLCAMDAEKVMNTMKKYPFFKNNMLKAYAQRIQRLEQHIHTVSAKDSTTRITNFITAHVTEFGITKEGCITARNLLSHKDIAQLTNTSRQTVNSVLNQLRRAGKITYDTKTISIYTSLHDSYS